MFWGRKAPPSFAPEVDLLRSERALYSEICQIRSVDDDTSQLIFSFVIGGIQETDNVLFNNFFDIGHLADPAVLLGIFYDGKHAHHLSNCVVQLIIDINSGGGGLRISATQNIKPEYFIKRSDNR